MHVALTTTLILHLPPLPPSSSTPPCRYPVVSKGVLLWLESILLDVSFFEMSMENAILYLSLLDEAGSTHRHTHTQTHTQVHVTHFMHTHTLTPATALQIRCHLSSCFVPTPTPDCNLSPIAPPRATASAAETL